MRYALASGHGRAGLLVLAATLLAAVTVGQAPAAGLQVGFEAGETGYALAADGAATIAVSSVQAHSGSQSAKVTLSNGSPGTDFAKVVIPAASSLRKTDGTFWVYLPSGSNANLAPYMYFAVDANGNGSYEFTGGNDGDAFVIVFVTGGTPYPQETWFPAGINGSMKVHVVGNRTGLGATEFSASNSPLMGTLDDLRAKVFSGTTTWGDLNLVQVRVGAGEWPGAANYTAYVDDINVIDLTQKYVDDDFDSSTPGWGTTHFATIQDAVAAAAAGDTINVAAGNYSVTSNISLNKANLTIVGAGSADTIVEVSGTGQRFTISATGVTIQGLQIKKTDKASVQNIIQVMASNTTIKNNLFCGLYAAIPSDGETSRAMEVTGGLTGLLIEGNTIHNLRQPAYINKSAVTIKDNYVYGTKGWVISDGSSVTFTGNTWGSGAQANAVDVAIIVDSPATPVPGFYTDIAAISAANNGAMIEDQRVSPRLLSVVSVKAGAAAPGDGTAWAPYPTIGPAVARVATGGTINVAAGTYEEQVDIAKNLTLAGAGSETVIKSPAALALSFTTSAVNKPVVYVHGAANVVIRDLAVDGFGRGNSNYRFLGIAYQNAGGQVAHCVVKNIQDTPFSGAQHGVALGAYNTDATARSLVIAGCDIYNFQKGGIVVSGAGLTVDIRGNTVEGVGPTTVTAMNGIQVSEGVTGQVRDNLVSGCYYTGSSWAASAIIDYGTNVTLSGNTATGSNFGLYFETGAAAATAFGNNIAGNDYGIVSGYNSAGLVDASQNWWGTPSGPTIVSGPGTLYAGDGDAVYDYSVPALNVSSPLAKPATANTLYIEPTTASIYIKPTETCVMDVKVANLQQPVTGLQAMLGFSSTYFRTGSADVAVAPGGGDWDQLIYGVWSTGGDLDMAVGVRFELSTGTQADATTAKITLTPTGTQGYTRMVFRPDLEPDEFLIGSTFLSNLDNQPVWPLKVGSMNIVIDGTSPTLAVASAAEAGQELIGTSTNAAMGVIDITVTAADALAGLAAAPAITVTPNGAAAQAATYAGESPAGTFHYTWSVAADTPNGVATITATVADKAGNASSDTASFNINKHEITGTVELEGLIPPAPITRTVTFVATGGTASKTWSVPVDFAAHARVGTFRLVDVPAGTTNLSAKTAWNLRRKLAVGYTDDRAVVDFTGGSLLLGGDLNGSNSINVLDYSVMKTRWFTTDPVADINASGRVDLTDYSIQKANWFKVGDPQ